MHTIEVKECNKKFNIEGDHPVLQRIVKFKISYIEASKIIIDMMYLGYENIKVKEV